MSISSYVLTTMTKVVSEYLTALDGIPDDDLASWLPAAASTGGGDMNTFSAMAVHTVNAGRWMLVHQVLGEDMPRDRDAEFRAVATRAEIDSLFQKLLDTIRLRADDIDAIDLTQAPPTIRETAPHADRGFFLLHMLDHTALHLGHAQIQRQLWLAEKGQG